MPGTDSVANLVAQQSLDNTVYQLVQDQRDYNRDYDDHDVDRFEGEQEHFTAAIFLQDQGADKQGGNQQNQNGY